MIKDKGLLELIEATKLLKQKFKNFELLIIGLIDYTQGPTNYDKKAIAINNIYCGNSSKKDLHYRRKKRSVKNLIGEKP